MRRSRHTVRTSTSRPGSGMPAHVTVTYPFRPPGLLTAVDHRRLEHVFASRPAFSLTGIRTAWFGDAVLYVRCWPRNRTVRALIDAVTEAYPGAPAVRRRVSPTSVPHLTIGHDHDVATLRAAADAVTARLPFVQEVGEVGAGRAGPTLDPSGPLAPRALLPSSLRGLDRRDDPWP